MAEYTAALSLSRYRERWDIQTGRDGFRLYSALRRPTPSALIYLVAHSAAELRGLIERIEASGLLD